MPDCQSIVRLLWGCDVSSSFYLFHCLFSESVKVGGWNWLLKLTHTVLYTSNFGIYTTSWLSFVATGVPVPKHRELLSGLGVLSVFPTCQNGSQSLRQGVGVDMAHRWSICTGELPNIAHCRPDFTEPPNWHL